MATIDELNRLLSTYVDEGSRGEPKFIVEYQKLDKDTKIAFIKQLRNNDENTRMFISVLISDALRDDQAIEFLEYTSSEIPHEDWPFFESEYFEDHNRPWGLPWNPWDIFMDDHSVFINSRNDTYLNMLEDKFVKHMSLRNAHFTHPVYSSKVDYNLTNILSLSEFVFEPEFNLTFDYTQELLEWETEPREGKELLGCYRYTVGNGRSSGNEVILYMGAIHDAARSLSVDRYSLAEVVLIHEFVHLVISEGVYRTKKYTFPKNCDETIFQETAAQYFTYYTVRRKQNLLQAFLRLNEKQNKVYRLWTHRKECVPKTFIKHEVCIPPFFAK